MTSTTHISCDFNLSPTLHRSLCFYVRCTCVARSNASLTVGDPNNTRDNSTCCLIRRSDYRDTDGEWWLLLPHHLVRLPWLLWWQWETYHQMESYTITHKRTALCTFCKFLEALDVGQVEWKWYFCVAWYHSCEVMKFVRQWKGAYAYRCNLA